MDFGRPRSDNETGVVLAILHLLGWVELARQRFNQFSYTRGGFLGRSSKPNHYRKVLAKHQQLIQNIKIGLGLVTFLGMQAGRCNFQSTEHALTGQGFTVGARRLHAAQHRTEQFVFTRSFVVVRSS